MKKLKKLKRKMRRFELQFVMLSALLLSPLLLPLGLVSCAVYLHQLRRAAERFRCTACAQILGRESIELADTVWGKRTQELEEPSFYIKRRIVRTVHAVCASCGKQYQYIEKTRQFTDSHS